jgi:quinoprotein glucose dehydrogenase
MCVFALVPGMELQAQGATGGDTNAGVFTDAQAARGEQAFSTYCAACHGIDLSGKQPAPALAGDAFVRRWYGHTLGELFQRMSNTMPQQSPHSLSERIYVDITAFIVQANGYPSGAFELDGNAEVLNHIRIAQSPSGS